MQQFAGATAQQPRRQTYGNRTISQVEDTTDIMNFDRDVPMGDYGEDYDEVSQQKIVFHDYSQIKLKENHA